MHTIGIQFSKAPAIDQLDLTTKGVLGHFAQEPCSSELMGLLMSMDKLDNWAVDQDQYGGPDQFDLQLLMQEILAFVETYSSALHYEPQLFAELLAHLTSTRCTYLYRYVAQHNVAFCQALPPLLAGGAQQPMELRVLQQRLEAFGKARLLSEIFSSERLREISQIMENYADV